MTFAHDTDVSLHTLADLVNTATPVDELTTISALNDFVERWEFTGYRAGNAQELQEVRAYRDRIRSLWDMNREEAVHLTNQILQENQAVPQLVTHDNWDWHLHAIAQHAPLAARMAVEAAMALIDVIRADDLDRFKYCAGQCGGVLIDLSRNRSRRYCGRECGNREHVAAYRARQASRE